MIVGTAIPLSVIQLLREETQWLLALAHLLVKGSAYCDI